MHIWAGALTRAELVIVILVALLAALVAALALRTWKLSRLTPEQFELKRRANLATHGKMGDANLVEVRENLLIYAYDVRGVRYTAAQDISTLQAQMPPDASYGIGPVNVKYDPRNPANSILLSEEWTGLRTNHNHR